MSLTDREFWSVIHGMGLGAVFLLAFAGGLAGLYSLRPELVTVGGVRERLPRLEWGTGVMAVVAWLTVITGTYIVYPWYRATPPPGTTGDAVKAFPSFFLLASERTAAWNNFGMEWKAHVAWIAPILATSVAIVVFYYGPQLVKEPHIRRALMMLFSLSFAAAAVAGLFGAFISKVAPTI